MQKSDLDTRKRGSLIAFEGIDGVGKTTQACLLAASLGAVSTFQFGATSIGAKIRAMLLDPALTNVDARAEVLLIAADKAQHVREIVEPRLREGRDVVSDRFTGSTLAYQGFGHGESQEELESLLRFATFGVRPDLNVLLVLPVATAAGRLRGQPDRIESSGFGFMERVDAGYRTLARSDPERWVIVEGHGEPGEVAARVLEAVNQRLGSHQKTNSAHQYHG